MYKIVGTPKGGESEIVDEADTLSEAEYLANEYQAVFGSDWAIQIVRGG